jgi:protein disulfide-isomerase
MLNTFLFMFSALLTLCSCSLSALPGSVQWQTNYEQASQQAKAESKPLVLFFTGSDWCGWCNKIDEEAFETREFVETAGNKFVFVKLDFPLYSPQDPQLKAQNKALQQKFDIRSFPTIVVFDAKQNQQIGVTGYRQGGGKAFADHLLKLVNDYGQYKQKVSALDKTEFSGSELKHLYDKAIALNLSNDVAKITKKGMKSDEALFFMKERYRFLAEEGQIHSREAVAIRQQILSADPTNAKRMHYEIAVADFEAYTQNMERDGYAPEVAVAPLIDYIEKFGAQDKDNLWRLHILISQVYLDKNKMTTALKYAQHSYESAPSGVQPELARAVQNMRSQLNTTP